MPFIPIFPILKIFKNFIILQGFIKKNSTESIYKNQLILHFVWGEGKTLKKATNLQKIFAKTMLDFCMLWQ